MDQNEQVSKNSDLPLLPLRDVVVYPHMVIPLFVGRQKSIEALESAMRADKQIVLVAQKSPTDDDPTPSDLYQVGTLATILQLLKLPDGTVKVLVEGGERVSIDNAEEEDGHYRVAVSVFAEEALAEEALASEDAEALIKTARDHFEQYVSLSRKVSSEVMSSLSGIDDPSRFADTVAAHMALELEQKQAVLELTGVRERIESLLELMDGQIDLLQVEKKIRGRVKKQMEKSQREYYLNEQMKAIQKELGDMGEEVNEVDELEQKIADSGMSEEAQEKTRAELGKLKMMSPMSAEASVLRAYIDWMIKVPWKKRSKVRHDLARAEAVLEKDHHGLEEVKERILEYLAVQKRVKKIKGPILCLVGPPGVGKTSLGESIARATNRKFVRMALGGVRDEAEIRGHRRTYIGSLPGKLVQKMAKAGVKNPLFLLDEVDKMGMDNRGDPASALLEVLDPEQNNHFNDHYLEVDYDLSDVMFVCTSNSMNIPGPLLDRMEVIRIPGYTEEEKLNIAKKYLIPKQVKANGLKEGEMAVDDDVIRDIIRYYTREAGVRGLDREVAKLARKVVTKHVRAADKTTDTITVDALEDLLGVRKFDFGRAENDDQIGQVTGLAWTQVGGELLTIESTAVKGKGRVIKTGSLGDVMQESIQAALTVVRSRAQVLGVAPDYHEKMDIHIHVPEGATPKDGPSAGVGMCTALVSVLTSIPVRADVAMTGEITLRGEVLRIGGLKEKLLAAHRGGIKTVVIPADNERDLKEIPDNIKADLTIRPVKWIDEVLQIALQHTPTPLSDEEYQALEQKAEQSENGNRINTH
jgi:ATP-dependent Lon protease